PIAATAGYYAAASRFVGLDSRLAWTPPQHERPRPRAHGRPQSGSRPCIARMRRLGAPRAHGTDPARHRGRIDLERPDYSISRERDSWSLAASSLGISVAIASRPSLADARYWSRKSRQGGQPMKWASNAS